MFGSIEDIPEVSEADRKTHDDAVGREGKFTACTNNDLLSLPASSRSTPRARWSTFRTGRERLSSKPDDIKEWQFLLRLQGSTSLLRPHSS